MNHRKIINKSLNHLFKNMKLTTNKCKLYPNRKINKPIKYMN